MIPTITASEHSPNRGQGLARDMPVCWALEEIGQLYDVRLVSFSEMKGTPIAPAILLGGFLRMKRVIWSCSNRAPLCSIPRSAMRACRRAMGVPERANIWMFAALSTVEPVIAQREVSLILESGKTWHEERLPIVEDCIRSCPVELGARPCDGAWLDGAFSAGDLLIVRALRRLRGSNILDDNPNLEAYIARDEARPAFKRAFEAQLTVFTGKAPGRQG